MMTPLTIVFLAISVLLTAVISGVVGMAGGVTLLSLMTFFLKFEVIVPLHGIVQLTSNLSRFLFLKKFIHRKIALFFFIGAPLGTLLAYTIITSIPSKKYVFIPMACLIFYTLFKPKKLPPLMIPLWGFSFLGLLTGLLAPLIGATGPLLAPFFLRDDLTKEEIVATKAVAQMFTHLLKIPLFIKLAFPYQDYALPLAIMVVCAFIGTKLGVMLLGKVSEGLFKKIYQFALLIAGIRILTKIFLV